MFKNIPFLLVALLVTTFSLAQKKEKIKGSKIVTVAIKELKSFENIEVGDNFEVLLVKGDKPSLEIEADDNLHDIINFEVTLCKVTQLGLPVLDKPVSHLHPNDIYFIFLKLV